MIHSLVDWALRQRVLILVVAIALGIAGLLSVRTLSIDAFPDMTNVQVQVATVAPGRPPEDIERTVTIPLEMALRGLPGLEEMRSMNRNGLSLISLVFSDKTDVYFARQLVLERMIEAQAQLPEGITPVLGPVSSGLGEIYQYTLEREDDGDRDLTIEELRERRDVQDWIVRPMLRSLRGVADINSMGGYIKQYQVIPNPDRLRYYGFTVKDLVKALAANNANSSGGPLNVREEQLLVAGVGLITQTQDIEKIVLREVRGIPIYVKDVATVQVGEEVRRGAIIKNGVTEGVAGIVQMQLGGNAREVVNRIKARVAQINANNELPGGLKIVPFYDRTMLVDAAMNNVIRTLIEGVILVIIVLVLFLGDLRSSLIVTFTLLLTPVLTFLAMNQIGLGANLMSLGGLAIAIGLMVDGAVVVVENAFVRLGQFRESRGLPKSRYVLDAASEVGKPVLYGVGIIILVFLPLLSLQGMEGKMFAPLAMTIALAMTISLILSFLLTPVLASYMLKGGNESDTFVLRVLRKPYQKALHWAMDNGKKVLLIAVGLLVAAGASFPLLGTSFVPTMQEGSVTPVLIRMPNISIDESIKLEREALKAVMEVPGVDYVVARMGGGGSPADQGLPHESDPIATLKPRDQWPKGWTQDDIADAIREKLKFLPGVEVSISQPIAARVDEMVSGVRTQVALKIFGDDLEKLGELGNQMARIMSGMKGTTDMRVDRVDGQNYLMIKIDRDAIARFGINVEDVNTLIEAAIQGKEATTILQGERRYGLIVRYPLEYRDSVHAISSLVLRSSTGALVPLKDLATIEVRDGPPQIARDNGKRRIVVGGNVQGRDMGGYVAEAQQKIAEQVQLPEGYELVWGGQFENMERATKRLAIIVPITIGAIFFLLYMLFNSVRQAGLIITVLPLAAIGGVFGLLVSGEYLSVPAAVGFINLWGIAVLNGVVLISQIRSLTDEGMTLREAIIEGCEHRFRPVMMTATVAMLALIPMLFATGPGSEVTRPLAVVVIGGLITSTSLTLLALPVLYRMFGASRDDLPRYVTPVEALPPTTGDQGQRNDHIG